jgi:hypothetical protein
MRSVSYQSKQLFFPGLFFSLVRGLVTHVPELILLRVLLQLINSYQILIGFT